MYIVPIYSLAVKEVSMKVPGGNWANCGGTINEKIKIKISDKELRTECVTKASPGEIDQEIIVWNTIREGSYLVL